MKHMLAVVVITLSMGTLGSPSVANAQTAPSARHYDCSKAGNANKAACRGTLAVPVQRSRPMTAAASTGPTRAVPHYNCSLAGNANKVACRGTQPAPIQRSRPAPAAVSVGPARAAPHYNCSLAGNANKVACRGPASGPVSDTALRPAPRSAAAPRAQVSASGPQGATAMCNDNTYSHSAHHAGTCSHHGGVKQFY